MYYIPSPAVLLAIVGNLLIVVIYLILRNNGEKVSLVYGAIFKNPVKLYQLAKRSENYWKKTLYFTLVFSLPLLLIAFAYTAFNQIYKSTARIECMYVEYFKNREWNGIVAAKYLDTENDGHRTIKVESGDRNIKIQGQILSEFDNYEQIQIGDSISKVRGELLLHLYRADGKIELRSDFECEN